MADYKELAQRWFAEVMNEGNEDVIDEICAPNFVDHDPLPGTGPDRDGIHEFVKQVRSAFPDLETTVDDILAEGDEIAVRSTFRGTHEGDFMGIPATGKKVEVANYDFVRIQNDQAVEHWGTIDSAALMEQLGAVPAGT
ncbi:MAG TPA: ester cyclase [Solirubrobacterales bacterium]|nr:ester cyclase [Solirubrobacterales bacterium]